MYLGGLYIMSLESEKITKLGGTFLLNKKQPIFRWYKYDEGYSGELIKREFLNLNLDKDFLIYDPFGGSGTTMLVASQLGKKSLYSETNPFMRFVVETKINRVYDICKNKTNNLKKMKKTLEVMMDNYSQNNKKTIEYDGFEKYYDKQVLVELLYLKGEIKKIYDRNIQDLFMLALSSILVRVSKMIKRGDLRYAKEGEKKPDDSQVFSHFQNKVEQIISDIEDYGETIKEKTLCVSEDAREIELENKVDVIITSPPYLNGTNYIRNTKLELKMLDFIVDEKDLANFHRKGIIAGINNVSSKQNITRTLSDTKKYEIALENTYDKRIPKMIVGYFEDMSKVIEKLCVSLKIEGLFIMDIGDSQFDGVHIKTDEELKIIAESVGFELIDTDVLRTRRSKNNMILSQKLLRFKKGG